MAYEEYFIEKKLPQPLADEEFLYYFEQYKKGDTEARGIIIEHNIALILYCVDKKFKNAPYEKKELVSAGILGLMRAVDSFDLSKGKTFSTIAYPSIFWAIRNFIRSNDKDSKVLSFQQKVSLKEEDTYTLEDVLVSDDVPTEEQYEEKEILSILQQLLTNLSEKEKLLIDMYFYQQLPQREIAQKLGLS